MHYVSQDTQTSPSPGFSSRGGAKTKKRGQKPEGGATFLKYSIGCMQQPGGQTWNGGTPISNGGRAPLGPPLATALRRKQCVLQVSGNIAYCSRWSLSTLTFCGGIHELQKSEQRGWNPNPEANAVPRELCCSVVKTGAFKVRKAFSF